MRRQETSLNADWLYLDHDDPAAAQPRFDDGGWRAVCLPHTTKVMPINYFDDREYQVITWYRRHLPVPPQDEQTRVFVDFDGVLLVAEVFLNGTHLAEHVGGFTPFSVDITDHLVAGDNVLAVRVDSREREDIPPFGNVVDYLVFGGIYRDVRLCIVHRVHVQQVFARTADVLTEAPRLMAAVRLAGPAESGTITLSACLTDPASGRTWQAGAVRADSAVVEILFPPLTGIERWSIDSPKLYSLEVEVKQGGQTVDRYATRIGFREARFQDDGFHLNGRRLKLFGLNRHQTYPYIGAAAPARLQRRDADIIKYELGANIVRTSHYPQSPHFLDRCDEIGLLVFEEIPGWQHIGDAAWQERSKQELREMILRDRNHAAIILWGVRINESWDEHDFYTETNRIARDLDPTRQTGGVRFWPFSEFLEDVYTYNDFSMEIVDPVNSPHLVTEFAGHTFPTKSWDSQQRQTEHALLHARIHNAQFGNDKVCGAIGWCAFDYNTHRDFGSGDRVAYHGVMDMYRFPKFAGWFYESQIDPAIRCVLHPATFWTMNDRDGGGLFPLVVFSNCDEVEMITGDGNTATFQPDRETYPYLPHPPFVCGGWEMNLGTKAFDVQFIGRIGGREVVTRRMAIGATPAKLRFTADDEQLVADGSDMTRIAFAVVDADDNILPYVTRPVTLSLEGPGELIGDNPACAPGGRGAVFLRAGRKTGTVILRAIMQGLPIAEVRVQIVQPES